MTDWRAWHRDHDDPGSSLSERRASVQRHVRTRLDIAAGAPRTTGGMWGEPGREVETSGSPGREVETSGSPGREIGTSGSCGVGTGGEPVRLISACAGDGRDVLDVLRPSDAVTGRLVELDPSLAAAARAAAPAGLEVVTGDAGVAAAYAGVVPADLVLLCGIFGNVTDDDIAGTVAATPMLCAPGAHVIWTRGRSGVGCGSLDPGVDRRGDLTPTIRGWFVAAGFTEVAWDAPADRTWSVGVHRYDGPPMPFDPDRRLFAFVR